jgi:hypothetical protein
MKVAGPVTFTFEGRFLEAAQIRGRGSIAVRPPGSRLVRLPITVGEVLHELGDERFFHGRVRVTVEVFEREEAPRG